MATSSADVHQVEAVNDGIDDAKLPLSPLFACTQIRRSNHRQRDQSNIAAMVIALDPIYELPSLPSSFDVSHELDTKRSPSMPQLLPPSTTTSKQIGIMKTRNLTAAATRRSSSHRRLVRFSTKDGDHDDGKRSNSIPSNKKLADNRSIQIQRVAKVYMCDDKPLADAPLHWYGPRSLSTVSSSPHVPSKSVSSNEPSVSCRMSLILSFDNAIELWEKHEEKLLLQSPIQEMLITDEVASLQPGLSHLYGTLRDLLSGMCIAE
jgi:hypothetical protein